MGGALYKRQGKSLEPAAEIPIHATPTSPTEKSLNTGTQDFQDFGITLYPILCEQKNFFSKTLALITIIKIIISDEWSADVTCKCVVIKGLLFGDELISGFVSGFRVKHVAVVR